MITFNFPQFKKHLGFFLLLTFFIISASCQSTTIATADGQPSLSAEMVYQYKTIYEFILKIKLNKQQYNRLQKGLAHYWIVRDVEAIRQTVSDLKYYGNLDELETLRNSSQQVIAEAFRKDSNDSVSKVLIEAYDLAHPEQRAGTAVKGFADIKGVWGKTDGLIAEKTYVGQPAGISYTETEKIEISPDGKFKHIKVHSHYSGPCSYVEGTTETGTVCIKGSKLIFYILSGSGMITDACSPSLNKKIIINPRTDRFTWSIRSNINNPNVQTLCLNKNDNTAVCLDKQ